MVELVWLGFALGAGAALAIGPIFIAIVRESTARGFRAGCGVIYGATAVDAVLLLPLLVGAGALALTPELPPWLGVVGAPCLLYLALASGRDARSLWRGGAVAAASSTQSFRQGVAGSLASPLSWALWLGANLPALLYAQGRGGWGGVTLFVVAWFGATMVLEMVLALVAARAGRALGGRGQACLSAGAAGCYLALAGGLIATMMVPGIFGG